MRFSVRTQPYLKSAVYAVAALALLLFSSSFYPALGITEMAPQLTVAMLACLALFEGVRYAAYFAVIFGAAEAFVYGESPLLNALFYVAFALTVVWLFENVFGRNFAAWLLYAVGGILCRAVFSMFAPVTAWGITAADVLLDETLPTFLLSVVFSLPLYPIYAWLKKKTE